MNKFCLNKKKKRREKYLRINTSRSSFESVTGVAVYGGGGGSDWSNSVSSYGGGGVDPLCIPGTQ